MNFTKNSLNIHNEFILWSYNFNRSDINLILKSSWDPVNIKKVKNLELTTASVKEVNRSVQSLGHLVEEAMASTIQALLSYDKMLCETVIVRDTNIDRVEIEVEEQCVHLLCENQLEPNDIRNVVAILKINNNLERIGDLAVNIAETMIRLIDMGFFRRVRGAQEMSQKAQAMLNGSLRAFTERDTHLARKIIASDDEVDRLQTSIQQRIQDEIDRIPEHVGPLMQLNFVVRQLERVGDMATNISEDIIYMVESKIVRHSSMLGKRDTNW